MAEPAFDEVGRRVWQGCQTSAAMLCLANGLISEFVELAADQQFDDAFRHPASQEYSTRELTFGVRPCAKAGWIYALASEPVIVAAQNTVRDQNCGNSKLPNEMGDV